MAPDASDEFLASATLVSGINPLLPSAERGVSPNMGYWKARLIGPSHKRPLGPSLRGKYPTLPGWSKEQEAPSAISPTYPAYGLGANMTSTYGNTSPMNVNASVPFEEQSVVPEVS